MVKTTVLMLVFIASIIAAYGALFLKKGAKFIHRNIFSQIKNWRIFLGIFLYLIGSIFFIAALKQERLSIIYPITSLTYIWIALLSKKHLDEAHNKYKWVGIILIIIGVILMTR